MGKRAQYQPPEVQLQQTEHNSLVPLDKIEAEANELYVTGQRERLLAIWDAIDEDSRLNYFNLAVNVVKIYLESGSYYEAEKVLRVLAKYHEQHNNAYEQARIHLQRASLYLYTHNDDAMFRAIEQVRGLTTALNLLAECENLEGELIKGKSPEAAIRHYRKAANLFREYTHEDEHGTYDLARTYLLLADAVLVQGQIVSGKTYLRQAQACVADFLKIGMNPDVVGWAYIKMGSSYEVVGEYERAQAFYEEAETTAPHNKTRMAEVRWHKAYLAMLRGNDMDALRELDLLDLAATDNITARMNGLLTKGYIHLYVGEPEKAEQFAIEAQQTEVDDQSLLSHRAFLLRAAALIMQDKVNKAILDTLETSVNFLVSSHHYVESSQGYLIYAWGCVMLNHISQAQEALVQCIRQADLVQHVRHLTRLYKLSQDTLNGWWQTVPNYNTFFPRLTACLNELPDQASRDHLYLRSMGKTQIMVGNEEVLTAGRGDNLILALFFYMVQHQRARYKEITAALWSDEEAIEVGEDRLRRRLNFHNAHLKQKFGFEWMAYDPRTEYYTLNTDRIAYHDADVFEHAYREAAHTRNESTRLLKYQQVINLYTDDYLKELSFDFVEQQRIFYCRIYYNLLDDAITLAEKLERQDLATVWKLLREKFQAQHNDYWESAVL